MTKKIVAYVLLLIAVAGNIFSGEWDYVLNVRMLYSGNYTDAQWAATDAYKPDGFGQTRTTKLPKQVTAAMHEALQSYDLDVGDCFIFICGSSNVPPGTIMVILRITQINRDGTYRYVFRAWQK